MLIALERMLAEADRRGLHSVRIDEMIKAVQRSPITHLSFGKRLLVGLWLGWEKLFQLLFQIKTISQEDPFLHYRLRKYQGRTVHMDNGETLSKGDKVIELHFDNRQLFELGVHSRSTAQLAIRLIRRMEKDLPVLAKRICGDVELAEAKALYGVSMINRGPEKFGFIVLDLPSGLFASSTKFYLSILMSVIHPSGGSRLKERSDQLVPKMILMPVSQLLDQMNRQLPHKHVERVHEEERTLEAELPGATVVH